MLAQGPEANGRIEPGLVRNDNLFISGYNNVQLQYVDAQFKRMEKGWECVFGQQTAAATVAVHFGGGSVRNGFRHGFESD